VDRRLLRYYDRELRHLQTGAKEFAREFPKIAGRLAIEDFPCVDPYVERLLEGFAFLTARVQLKLDSEFPRFTQNLLETVYPSYLAPTPSMCIAQFNHDTAEAGLADGYVIPRNTVLRSAATRDLASCEYRTSHATTLWPLRIEEAQYYTRNVGVLDLSRPWGGESTAPTGGPPKANYPVRAALRLRLTTTANVPMNKVGMKNLRLCLTGGEAGGYSTAAKIYEQLFAHARSVVVRPVMPGNAIGSWQENFPANLISRVGFRADESLLPYDARGFQGYRLLHEYFAFPQRFLFVDIGDLSPALRRAEGMGVDIIIAFSQEMPELESAIDGSCFALHCTPAANLFPKRADRIFISDRASEFQIIPDRTRPLDFEVYKVTRVTGFAGGSNEETIFRPFYAAGDSDGSSPAYYATHRVPRAVSEHEKRSGSRSTYAGSEVYVSLVDAASVPYSTDLRQLAIETVCTNRDLPLQMPVGKGKTDFTMEIGAPVESVRVIAGPTPPRPSHVEGETSWRLISHLKLNYLSLMDEDLDGDGEVSQGERQGAAAMRDLLRLYGSTSDAATRKQIEGLKTIDTVPITRRAPSDGKGGGALAFARGLEVMVTFDETLFEGSGVFLLGAVLEQFYARYVSMNSFTETVIRSVERGEIMRWTAKVGQRPVL
jgi:type VI secretion system protein ImpG